MLNQPDGRINRAKIIIKKTAATTTTATATDSRTRVARANKKIVFFLTRRPQNSRQLPSSAATGSFAVHQLHQPRFSPHRRHRDSYTFLVAASTLTLYGEIFIFNFFSNLFFVFYFHSRILYIYSRRDIWERIAGDRIMGNVAAGDTAAIII